MMQTCEPFTLNIPDQWRGRKLWSQARPRGRCSRRSSKSQISLINSFGELFTSRSLSQELWRPYSLSPDITHYTGCSNTGRYWCNGRHRRSGRRRRDAHLGSSQLGLPGNVCVFDGSSEGGEFVHGNPNLLWFP